MTCQDEVIRIGKKLEKMISSKNVVSFRIIGRNVGISQMARCFGEEISYGVKCRHVGSNTLKWHTVEILYTNHQVFIETTVTVLTPRQFSRVAKFFCHLFLLNLLISDCNIREWIHPVPC